MSVKLPLGFSRVKMRMPLRFQIIALLMIFLTLVVLAFYNSTRSFLEKDKIGTVRELQTLQVADLARDVSDRIQKARQELRETGVRLLDPGRGVPTASQALWSWIVVRDKSWRSPSFQGALPSSLDMAGNGSGDFTAWVDPKDGMQLILAEPLKINEGSRTQTIMIYGRLNKRAIVGDEDKYIRGPIRGVLFESTGLSGQAQRSPANVMKLTWAGPSEAVKNFAKLFMELPESGQTSLTQPSQPSSREFRDLASTPRTLLSWATVPVPNTAMNLVAVAFVNQDEILKGFKRAIAEQAFWALLILGFGVIAARFLASKMSQPIEQMVSATRLIETGDFQVRLPADRPDELGDLAAAFNHMGQALDEREQALKSAQMALVQSEKLAALGTLSAGIAHEVKNPLAGILGHADMALDGIKKLSVEPANPILRHLETIQKEVKRCRGIIDNLMRFSRKDTENKVENELLDLELVAWEAIHLTEHSLNMQKVKIEKNFSKEAMMILGNSNQIEQVILNMVQNAGHAMPEGGTITVSTEYLQENEQLPKGAFLAFASEEFQGAFMRIAIRDTGVGMSEEVQRKIFEPFFTTKPKGVGTGLGLSVTMGILGDHKARVSLRSAPGQGTTFFIDFVARAPRNQQVIHQLEEVMHRSGGGTKLASDVTSSPSVAAKPIKVVASAPPAPVAHHEDEPVAGSDAPELSQGFSEADGDDAVTGVTKLTGSGSEPRLTIPSPNSHSGVKSETSKLNSKFSIRKPVAKKNVG